LFSGMRNIHHKLAPSHEYFDHTGFRLDDEQRGLRVLDRKTGAVMRPSALRSSFRERQFAVGDMWAGNVKRVASPVGEGAISIHLVHRVLAEL